jgi:hypothetical protein
LCKHFPFAVVLPRPGSINLLRSGNPAADDDVWFRHLIEGDAVRNDARIKKAYIRKHLGCGTLEGDITKSEISGRLFSHALDIAAHASACATRVGARGFYFRGIMFACVEKLRGNDHLDVIEDPYAGDGAHANLVVTGIPYVESDVPGSEPKISEEFTEFLASLFDFLDPGCVETIEAARLQLFSSTK